MILSYAFIQAQITADNSFPVGNLLLDAPRHSGALWSIYEWRRSWLRGLGLGGGLTATTYRQRDLNNSFLLPGYARLDTALYYNYAVTDRTSWRFSFNLENALDRTYYQSSTVNQIRPGAPLTILAAVRWTRH